MGVSPSAAASTGRRMQMSPVLDAAFALENVTLTFGEIRAVDEVSLAFARGRTSVLIGSSGSGKSSILRLLLGLEWPDAGRVLADGAPLERDELLALRRRIGYVIQDGGLFPHLTLLGNLSLLPRYLGWDAAHIRVRAAELAALTRLNPSLLTRFPAELSGGERQRGALMRALMLDPPALMLDEPLGALDPLVRHDLQDDLRDIFSRLGKTVILVTHDLAEAAFFSARLILMHEGRIVQDGGIDDFRTAPADQFVRRFLAAYRTLPEAIR